MSRSSLYVACLAVLLLLPVAVAGSNPAIGYHTSPGETDIESGDVHSYDITLSLTPPDGKTEVDLEVDFLDRGSGSIAPESSVQIRDSSSGTFESMGSLQGYGSDLTKTGLTEGQYVLRVTSTVVAEGGDYTSSLRMVARDPTTASASPGVAYPFTFHVAEQPNQDPTAAFTYSVSGRTVSFDGSASEDPDGDALSYSWEFGDETTDSGVTTVHTYAQEGTFVVTLTVEDGEGGSDFRTRAVPVHSGGGSPGGDNGGSGDAGQPSDRDGDGYSDQAENNAGSDPDDPDSTPADRDGDGYPNEDEAAVGSDPDDDQSTPSDRDADGHANEQDNCPTAGNPDQEDNDADGIGDVCDQDPSDGPSGDADGDGVSNQEDVCPTDADPDQNDLDGDGAGDACDLDRDGDGKEGALDEYPDDPDEWRDLDRDGVGDNADPDDDGDGLSDVDEAAIGSDPSLADSDGDGVVDGIEVAMGSDPLDISDSRVPVQDLVAVPFSGGVMVSFRVHSGSGIDGFEIYRASALSLLASPSFEDARDGIIRYWDEEFPAGTHRYYVMPVIDGVEGFSESLAVRSNVVSLDQIQAAVCDPAEPDSDGDGLCDRLESELGTHPLDEDSDDDGLSDGEEVLSSLSSGGYVTSPLLADTDGDGVLDGAELDAGTDPISVDSVPPSEDEPAPVSNQTPALALPFLILALLGVALRRRQ